MKIFILGANGQLGRELVKKPPSSFEISSFSKNQFNLNELDLHKNKILELKPNWIINAAAYTHTSVGISDAVRGIRTSVIEVHISNTKSREEFRKKSFISPHAQGIIQGFGLYSYDLAILSLIND